MRDARLASAIAISRNAERLRHRALRSKERAHLTFVKTDPDGQQVKVIPIGVYGADLKRDKPRKAKSPVPGYPAYKPGMRAAEFYQTREWFELRYATIRKHGPRCMCCGATKVRMNVDHIKPRSKHPTLELDPNNLQVLCEACNIGKSNKDETDWRTQGAITQPR